METLASIRKRNALHLSVVVLVSSVLNVSCGASTATKSVDPVLSPPGTIQLTGTIQGNYVLRAGIPDTGAGYDLSGTGTVQPLGAVQANGSFHTTGFIQTGTASGDLALEGKEGSLALTLKGPEQPGFSPPPSEFHFAVTGGTGAYAQDQGGGTVQLTLNPSPARQRANASQPGRNRLEGRAAAGQFTLTFSN